MKIYKRLDIPIYFSIVNTGINFLTLIIYRVGFLNTYQNRVIKRVLNTWNYEEVTDKKILTKLKLRGLG
jgi:hypothetical protein